MGQGSTEPPYSTDVALVSNPPHMICDPVSTSKTSSQPPDVSKVDHATLCRLCCDRWAPAASDRSKTVGENVCVLPDCLLPLPSSLDPLPLPDHMAPPAPRLSATVWSW